MSSGDPLDLEIARLDRKFQLWGYTVSMGQLLLRSPKAEGQPTRVDVLFQGVVAIDLPTTLNGLTVEATTADAPRGSRVFSLRTADGVVGFVTAGVVVETEDEGDYFEASRHWPAMRGPQ